MTGTGRCASRSVNLPVDLPVVLYVRVVESVHVHVSVSVHVRVVARVVESVHARVVERVVERVHVRVRVVVASVAAPLGHRARASLPGVLRVHEVDRRTRAETDPPQAFDATQHSVHRTVLAAEHRDPWRRA